MHLRGLCGLPIQPLRPAEPKVTRSNRVGHAIMMFRPARSSRRAPEHRLPSRAPTPLTSSTGFNRPATGPTPDRLAARSALAISHELSTGTRNPGADTHRTADRIPGTPGISRARRRGGEKRVTRIGMARTCSRWPPAGGPGCRRSVADRCAPPWPGPRGRTTAADNPHRARSRPR